MTPYYERNGITIYCGDCLEVMPKILRDDSIDLTVTSPPYDKLRKYNGYVFDFKSIARQLRRVTKPGGVVIWVVGDQTVNGSESGTSFRQALYFMGLGFNVETMIYQVAGTGAKGSNRLYWQGFEFMFVFSKGRTKTVNLIADIKNIYAGTKRTGDGPKTNLLKTRGTKGSRTTPKVSVRSNVWRYYAGGNGVDKTEHEAPFPEGIARDHIISWSNPGDIILDPMVGSGTTLKMAHQLSRRAVGIEISEEYCKIAVERLRQPSFFSLPTNGKAKGETMPAGVQMGLEFKPGE